MRKAYAIEFEVPDNITPAEEQLLHDALSRVDRYVANAQVINILPIEDAQVINVRPFEARSLATISEGVTSAQNAPVKVTTAAIPPRQAPVAPEADEAAPTFMFPKGLPPAASPEPNSLSTSQTSGVVDPLKLSLRRDILAAMSKGAYYEEAAKWFAKILAAMPVGQDEVLIIADFWQ